MFYGIVPFGTRNVHVINLSSRLHQFGGWVTLDACPVNCKGATEKDILTVIRALRSWEALLVALQLFIEKAAKEIVLAYGHWHGEPFRIFHIVDDNDPRTVFETLSLSWWFLVGDAMMRLDGLQVPGYRRGRGPSSIGNIIRDDVRSRLEEELIWHRQSLKVAPADLLKLPLLQNQEGILKMR